ICRGYHGVKPINDIRFDDRIPWRAKLLKTLTANYAKAPFLEETLDLIAPLAADPDDRLSDYNSRAIKAISRALGVDTGKIVTASELSVEGSGNELLISLTKHAGGTAYMCGGGSGGYQQDDLFTQAGVELVYQNFSHPVYPQYQRPDRFVPGLSIVDALMNLGLEALRALLHEGRQAPV
ncbi:MAG TPA: WbqC family protein, partial [Longimicrobium sp.]|nr:WbqC family protein [Longimicrobium sp.]